jgi:hypothetical protein
MVRLGDSQAMKFPRNIKGVFLSAGNVPPNVPSIHQSCSGNGASNAVAALRQRKIVVVVIEGLELVRCRGANNPV